MGAWTNVQLGSGPLKRKRGGNINRHSLAATAHILRESHMRKLLALLALSLTLSACGSAQLGGVGSMSDIKVVDSDVLPEPTRVDLFEQNRPYLIGPFDKLTIEKNKNKQNPD